VNLFPPGEIPISGEVQFWRMHPDSWRTALRNVRDIGITTIATYLSWRRQEPTPGAFDLRGGHGAELDVHQFLRLCREEGLRVILKPGPWICAEEPGGGLPDWIIQDASLIALDGQGRPVSGYNPPFKHPMPSYASTRFRQHVSTWIGRVWADLAEFTGPQGPVVATQYDNEPSLGFQDTMYGFDHHPDALAAWRACAGADLAPPTPRLDGPTEPTAVEERWASRQRHYIADYLGWLRQVNHDAGAPGLVGTVNLNTHPVRGWPQDGPVIADTLANTVVGEDHYFVPPLDETDLAGMALAAAQAQQSSTPLVWAPEIQAGIWRSPGENVDYPDPTVTEMIAWWSAALALGYQGFNLYMLVNRENWELAPLREDGSPTELGRALGAFLRTVRSVPDLSEFRPVADSTIEWSDAIRLSAYRVRGPQAHPDTEWDVPEARTHYDHAEQAALNAVAQGRQFTLGAAPTKVGSPQFTAGAGMLVRQHRHPDGREVLFAVRWKPEADASVLLHGQESMGTLTLRHATTGQECTRTGDQFDLGLGPLSFGLFSIG
jgi:hypothetical protein